MNSKLSVWVAVACLACSHAEERNLSEQVGRTSAALSSNADVLGFEVASTWHSSAALSLSDQHSQGAHSLAVRNVGWSEIVSDVLSGQPVSTTVTVDLSLPTHQPNPHWYGDLSLVIDAPSAGVNNAWIGQNSLNGLPSGSFRTLAFTLPQTIVTALSSTPVSDLRVKLILNVPYNTQSYLFDRLRLGQSPLQLPPRGHTVACSPIGACTFTTQIPASHAPEDVALSASSSLNVNDGVFVKEPSGSGASIVVSGGGPVNLGVDSHVGSVVGDGAITLRSRAQVDGRVVAGGTVTEQDGVVVVDGATADAPLDSIRKDSWDVTFPATTQDVSLEPDMRLALAPGAFRNLTIKSRSILSLAAGAYTFQSVLLEPQAQLIIDNTSGPTQISVRSSLMIRGRIATADEQRSNVRFLFAGMTAVAIEAPFLGTLVAPAATVNLGSVTTPGHRGAIFAKDIEVHQWSTFEHRPFRDEVCEASGQCRPVTPKPTSTSVGTLSKTLTWKTGVPVVQLSDSFQNVRSLQTSCRIARELCFDTRQACANDDPTACDDEVVCAQANSTCAPLYAADAAPGYTAATDPSLKFLRSSEVASGLGIGSTVDSLRFGGSDGRSLIYKHYVDIGGGQRVPVLGSQVVLRPSEDQSSVQRVASTLLGGFSVPTGTLMTAGAAIDLAISHVTANDLFDFDVSPTAAETALTAVRHQGRDLLGYLVPFQSPRLPGFIGGRVMVDGKTGDIVLGRDIANLRRPVAGDFGPPIRQIDPRLFQLFLQNQACQEDGHGLDRFGQERVFSTSLLPTGAGHEMVYGTVSCNEIDNFVDPRLNQFDVATFVPAVQEDLREPGFVPIEDAYKMVYTEEENEFFETSAVEAQFWGAKISQYYRQLNAQYGVGPGEIADYRVTPDGSGALPRIRMLSVVDFPGLANGKWFPPVTNETSITASNGIAVFGSSDADAGLRAWTDAGVIAHEFFHSVLYDHTGILGQGDPKDAPAIAEGLADCFEMLATHKFKSIMSHDPDVEINPFHLKQGVFVDSEEATKGQPSLAFPPDSARDAYQYWAGQRSADPDGHENSTLLSGVCKILITGGVNPVLGGDVNNFRAGDMAVIPLPYGDPGQTSLTQSHQGLVQVDQEANMSHLEELLVSTVQSGKITPASDFRDVIEAFATEAEDLAIKNQRAHNGRWDDHVLYESFPNFVRLAFSTYGWGRLQESSVRHGPHEVAPLTTIASLNLIGANEAHPEPIEGCVCGGDQDFFVLNERVRPGDTIHFAVESNSQMATRIFVNNPCNGFAFNRQEECGGNVDPKRLRYVYPDENSLPACKADNQLYPELCALEDPEHIPQAGSVEYNRPGLAVVFIGVTNGPMGGDLNYRLKAWIHHKQPLRAPSN